MCLRRDAEPNVRPSCLTRSMLATMRLQHVAILVNDYDAAIEFFVDVLGFELVEDSASLANDGRPKRWVVVRPPGAETGILLARADGERQASAVGHQAAGRVAVFLDIAGNRWDLLGATSR